jgi:hypothetical protein
MRKSLLVKLGILLLTISVLSGCILVPVPGNGGMRGSHDSGRGGHQGGDSNDRGGRH